MPSTRSSFCFMPVARFYSFLTSRVVPSPGHCCSKPLLPNNVQAVSPRRLTLALVTIMQFVKGLSDRQAADAVQARIDCKYALSLELDDPGFDAVL